MRRRSNRLRRGHPVAVGWIAEHARPVSAIASALGWLGDDRRGYPCPACGEATRDGRRGAVFVGASQAWKCYRCDAHGDGLDYLSYALTGKRLRDADAATVKAWLGVPAEHRHTQAVPREFVGHISATAEQVAAATPEAIAAFWGRCVPCPSHPFLSARRLAPPPNLARFLPASLHRQGEPPMAWPEWWPAGRAKTWRLVTRGWRFDGDRDPVAANLHGRAVVDPPDFDGRKIKTLWAKGTPSAGLLFWNEVPWQSAGLMLVCEGMTDWLAASCWATDREGVCVFGVGSGGASAFASIDVPKSADLILATDDDEPGDAYAAAVASHYRHRKIHRVRPSLFIRSEAAK